MTENKKVYTIDNKREVLENFTASVLKMDEKLQNSIVVSLDNYINRKDLPLARLNYKPEIGDICYVDYGLTYRFEAGYQHFGLVVSIIQEKLLVIPMTTGASAIEKSGYMPHLYYIEPVGEGMRPSVLFINDMKFISRARVIDCKWHLDTDSIEFQSIVTRVNQVLFKQN